MNYYFNKVTVTNYSNYEFDTKVHYINFVNEKDSTYILTLAVEKNSQTATLYDYKKKYLLKFDMNFDYEKIEDLNKLNHVILYNKVITGRKRKFKKFVEDMEHEKDSITNQTIVHLTQYKNSKRKKIINDHYYFFERNEKINFVQKNSLKDYIRSKYKININEDENLSKVIHLKDGKKAIETEIVAINREDFNFTFKIDDAIPFYIPKTTRTVK